MCNLTEYDKVEYNALRAEIIHHDRTCFNIISLLLGASTAIYGLVVKQNIFLLLIILSVIWFVGFLYIVEKRASIRRISYYIRYAIEPKDKKRWETFSLINDNIHFPKISPLKTEFVLLMTTNIVNCYWFLELQNIFYSPKIKVLIVLLFVTPVFYGFYLVQEYYQARKKESLASENISK